MKLARRLSIAISLGICLVLGINAWLRVDRDRQSYRADARLDHVAFGRGLASATEFVWVRDGAPVALEAVEQFNQRESHLTIRWVWPHPSAEEKGYAPRLPSLVPHTGEKTRSEVVLGEGGVPYMLSYVPVDVPGGRGGAIELYESLANEKTVLREILSRALITLALVVALCVALTFGFGILFVAAPLRALVAKAERIGAGDLSGPLAVAETSEIRELAAAMNTMCERLLEAREHVEQETLARIRAIEQLRHADRLRTVGELASGIAHQLGTPLNVVRVRGSMIARGEVGEPRMRELGAVIVDHVDRISDTIRQLLNFARRDELTFAPADLARTIQATVSLIEPLAHERRVKLQRSDRSEGGTIAVDARQMQQALTNILMNAVYVTPKGGEVSVTSDADAANFWIEISDPGEGIAEEHLPHIFEPFYTTKPAGDGTGLGLSVADEIVRRHGGRIEVNTSPAGTTFRVTLPRGGPPPA